MTTIYLISETDRLTGQFVTCDVICYIPDISA